MEVFSFPQFPASSSLVHFALYSNVSNAAVLRKRLIDAASAQGLFGEQEREAVNFSFIDARLVTSRLHLQTAIYQAILAQSQNLLRTRTVHSEVLWALNPTNNINESIRRYGISEASTDVLVVRIGDPDTSVAQIRELMSSAISGVEVSLTTLDRVTDWPSIRKYHKLNDGSFDDHEVVNNLVISTVAMKSVMA